MTGDPSAARCGKQHVLRISLARVVRLLAAAAFAVVPLALAGVARADEGSTIFQQKCSACHTIGKGDLVGPDLKAVKTEDPNWLRQWISGPQKMIDSNDPKAVALANKYKAKGVMPTLGLAPADIDAVVSYITQQAGTPASGKGQTTTAPALPPGDAGAGRELFVGGARLKNGGPPCMSCHSISGIGALGGGTLGPDLTDAYNKYGGDAGLGAFLTGVPTPTMSAVWTRQPLTPQEIANLVAFIKEGAVAQRPLGALAELTVLGIIALVILVAIAAVYWRRRLLGVRKPLVQRANIAFNNRKVVRRL
ncbi:MAG: cytochrome c [Candidatus Eremiobacteraeota bacterium]|nr:cytochrome c [Candidatus Eremiobacteraeota bacterium]